MADFVQKKASTTKKSGQAAVRVANASLNGQSKKTTSSLQEIPVVWQSGPNGTLLGLLA
jgi:hypothetical protein